MMKLFELLNGDCIEILKSGPDNSVDALITDPPAGIAFMGKEWDEDKGGRDQWVEWMTSVMKEALRVMKPGAHGLVWALPRTSHWTATALENAGFEVRDVVTHLFGTGFPKSLDISKAIDKAAGAERKVVGSKLGQPGYSNNATQPNEVYGKGFGNAAGSGVSDITAPATPEAERWQGWGTALKPASEHWILVRKPLEHKHTVAANVLKHGTGGLNIDASRIGTEVISTHGGGNKYGHIGTGKNDGVGEYKTHTGRFPANLVLDEEAAALLDAQSSSPKGSDGASRFFYVAKASKSEKGSDNTHPTVKSLALMKYLITLITPPGGVVLDPFMGSGSTGVAAQELGMQFIGIEKETEYHAIAMRRTGTK